MGGIPNPKSPKIPFYAFPELFRGQILAIHTLEFGKIFRISILTRTFAFSKISHQISGLVLSREYIFREKNIFSGKKPGPFFKLPISPSSL